MKPEDLRKVIQDTIEESIKDYVEQTEKRIDERIGELESKLDQHIENIQPMIDMVDVLSKLNRFLKWGGITLFAFLAGLYLLIRRV